MCSGRANSDPSYLGAYVQGLQSENLSIGLGSGDLVLENLELRKNALEELDLPITVKEGTWRDACYLQLLSDIMDIRAVFLNIID